MGISLYTFDFFNCKYMDFLFFILRVSFRVSYWYQYCVIEHGFILGGNLVKPQKMNKTLILDGAVGTELIKRGLKLPLPLWSASANISHPQIITKIHQDYINAGANIITTNTFRTTSWTYKKLGYGDRTAKIKAKESLDRAINCAQNTKGAMMIAGSITTIEDCYKPEMFPGSI